MLLTNNDLQDDLDAISCTLWAFGAPPIADELGICWLKQLNFGIGHRPPRIDANRVMAYIFCIVKVVLFTVPLLAAKSKHV